MLSPESCKKLIKLVEARPVLYDYTFKDFGNRAIVQELWDEISKEMNLPSAAFTWGDLLKSYTKYLRDHQSRGIKFWLADEMEFINRYIGVGHITPKGKIPDGIEMNDMIKPKTIANPQTQDKETVKRSSKIVLRPSLLSPPSPCVLPKQEPLENQEVDTTSLNKTRSTVLSSISAEPTRKIEERTDQSQFPPSPMESEMEHPIVKFVDSILPDIHKLSHKRKRYFKQDVLISLYKLLDDQET